MIERTIYGTMEWWDVAEQPDGFESLPSEFKEAFEFVSIHLHFRIFRRHSLNWVADAKNSAYSCYFNAVQLCFSICQYYSAVLTDAVNTGETL